MIIMYLLLDMLLMPVEYFVKFFILYDDKSALTYLNFRLDRYLTTIIFIIKTI